METAALLLEHPRIPFISYPYEWPFGLLKRAALFHLELHQQALEEGFNLIDGTAYNVQFDNCKPVFIDTLSLRPYTEGEYWLGYRQFCEQFLNPLLLTAKLGVPFHPWFRGALEGVPVEDMASLLPFSSKCSPTVYMHVVLHGRLSSKARQHNGLVANASKGRHLSRRSLMGLLTSLRSLIRGLKPKGLTETPWGDYEKNHSYQFDEVAAKKAVVCSFVERMRPTALWDLGCNSGDYSEQALTAGAGRVIGFDFDPGALEAAISRVDEKKLNMLPLIMDATNPSPAQGWGQKERSGFSERANADALIALAFLHHLIIGKNIPMAQAINWVVNLAPCGVLEFVPKGDPMVQQMLASRTDIFDSYDIETFRTLLGGVAKIVREEQVSLSGRTLFQFKRMNP